MLTLDDMKKTLPEEVYQFFADEALQVSVETKEQLKETTVKHVSDLSDAVKQLSEKDKALEEKNNVIDQKEKTVHHQSIQIENLTHQLNVLKAHRFGQRSEKYNADQGRLFNEAELEAQRQDIAESDSDELDVSESASSQPDKEGANKKKTGRRPLPKELPRIQITYDVSEEEKRCRCGCELSCIGQVKSEQLDYIPAKFQVLEHIRLKYACKGCEEQLVLAELPPQPLAKSMASSSLLSQICVWKYADHLPLYRQEQILQRHDVDISRGTMSRWMIQVGKLLSPLQKALQKEMQSYDIGYTDETTLQVLNEPGRRVNQRSYMWVFMGGAPEKRSVVYEYHARRTHDIPETFWGDFKGYLHSDAYAAYETLCNKKEIDSVLCWAHARRKFIEITKKSRKEGIAHEAVKRIAMLYKIEKKCKEKCLSAEEIKHRRAKYSKPLLEKLQLWLIEKKKLVPPSSPIAGAIQYSLNGWDNLIRYLDDGRLEIDNNAMERAVKPFAVGRKNWLFSQSEDGASSGAVIYSLLETCKIHKVEPYAYLKHVLSTVKNCESEEDYQALLPYNVDPLKLAAVKGVVA